MNRHTLIVLLAVLLGFAACGSQEPANPDMLPAEFDYAAGNYPYSVTLNQVTVQVESTQVIPSDGNLKPGYVYVVVTARVTNQSEDVVNSSEFRLIDEYLNWYESWQTNVSFGHELTALPIMISNGESVVGDQVFITPESTLAAGLNFRWQSAELQSRIDIALGSLALPTSP